MASVEDFLTRLTISYLTKTIIIKSLFKKYSTNSSSIKKEKLEVAAQKVFTMNTKYMSCGNLEHMDIATKCCVY